MHDPRPHHDPWLDGLKLRMEMPARILLDPLAVGGLALCRDAYRRYMVQNLVGARQGRPGALRLALRTLTPIATGLGMFVLFTFIVPPLLLMISMIVRHGLGLGLTPSFSALGVAVSALVLLGTLLRWWKRVGGTFKERLRVRRDTRRQREALMLNLLSRVDPFAQGECQVWLGVSSWALKANLADGRAVLVHIDEDAPSGPEMKLRLTSERPHPLHIFFPDGIRPQVTRSQTTAGHAIELTGVRATDARDPERRAAPEATLADILGQAISNHDHLSADLRGLAQDAEVDSPPAVTAWLPDEDNPSRRRLPLMYRHPPQVSRPQRHARSNELGLSHLTYTAMNVLAALGLVMLAERVASSMLSLSVGAPTQMGQVLLGYLGVGLLVGLLVQGVSFIIHEPARVREVLAIRPAHAAGDLVLDQTRLHTGGLLEGVDLDEPFNVHLSRDPEPDTDGQVWITVELRQLLDGQTRRSVAVATRLPDSPTLRQLPELRTDALALPSEVFLGQVWPEICYKAQLHGVRHFPNLSASGDEEPSEAVAEPVQVAAAHRRSRA